MDKSRYLALAFATADLLFEVDPNGIIVFAVSSAHATIQGTENDLIGRSWRELVAPHDRNIVEALFARLDDRRSGPAAIELVSTKDGRPSLANLSAIRLSPQQNISCAVVFGAAAAPLNALSRSVRHTVAEAEEFSAAVQARRFNLVFQPIVSLKTGEAEHFETLVRFHGDTSPCKLIRMAEELDMILELDMAIAEQALRQLRASADRELRLAINISGRSILDSMFISDLRRLIARHESGRRLIFEITESAAIGDLMAANRHIQQLRGDGHIVCLDDFGAGWSSYAYLQKLHVDVVKIDGRYVRELAEHGRDSKLVRHLVNLCRDLGVTTIAEMVINQPVEDAARAAGVDFGQGFHYGLPGAEPVFEPRTEGLMTSRRRTGVTQSG